MSRNRCETTCPCGLDLACRPEVARRPRSELFDGGEYKRRAGLETLVYEVVGWHKKGTLFAKVVCPLCRREFLGYFHPPDVPQYDGPEWKLYDTSYWSTYNDEPGPEDVRNLRDPAEVLSGAAKSPQDAGPSSASAPVPGPGEVRRAPLPEGLDGIRVTIDRMADFIRDGRSHEEVVESARMIAGLAAGGARALGMPVASEADRKALHLEAIHAWCRDNFEFMGDPAGMELIQTPRRQLRRMEMGADLVGPFWTPIQKLLAAKAKVDAGKVGMPRPKMVGDADEAVVVSLSLAAAVGIVPIEIRYGGTEGLVHHCWGAALVGDKWYDLDVLHERFGEAPPVAFMGSVPVRL